MLFEQVYILKTELGQCGIDSILMENIRVKGCYDETGAVISEL